MPTPLGWQVWTRITKEVTPGTFDGAGGNADIAPNAGATFHWLEQMDGNAINVRRAPVATEHRSAAGGNVANKRYSRRNDCSFTITTLLYPDQAPDLLAWAVPVDGVLPTWTVDNFDGIRTRRLVNATIAQVAITGDAESNSGRLQAAITGMGTKVYPNEVDTAALALADPGPDVYPAGDPYTMNDSEGLILMGPGGTEVMTAYRNVSITVANHLWGPFNESKWRQKVLYSGRDTTWTVVREYDSTADMDRFEQMDVVAATLRFNYMGVATKFLQFAMQAANYYTDRTVDGNFDSGKYQTLTMKAYRDPVTGTDMVVTSGNA